MRRIALHAGSWYSDDAQQLDGQLSNWLDNVYLPDPPVDVTDDQVRAIISPHAGYAYSGQAAAYAFKFLKSKNIKRVFILGPSHHVYLRDCALTACSEYATPLGNLLIDTKVVADLLATGEFSTMSRTTDEEEHSIEMQLPYLYKMLQKLGKEKSVKVVPILVGNLNEAAEKRYARHLAPYLASANDFFIISSDFCHWGSRFQYTFYSPDDKPSSAPGSVRDYKDFPLPIYKAIENLDREGMTYLEQLSADGFYRYLKSTHNTICGRHPIGLLLQVVLYLRDHCSTANTLEEFQLEFVYYAQSSQARSVRDSSVSYASAYLAIKS
ncbi:hypothetical protein IWQ61_006471 [Dispira simplex]|nr:hypothetical protein IWQ61_006471 [Dispira simplex]